MGNSKGTLKYRKVQRTPQNGENAGKKLWYATAVSDREMDFESFVTHISEHGSPYSRGCVHGVLMDALDHLQELTALAQSIRENGLLQPVTVRKAAEGYELVAGERRLRACQLAKMTTIPAILCSYADDRTAALGLLENIQRADLNPFEQAQGLRDVMVLWDCTQAEAAKRLGMAQPTFANKLRLLQLTADQRQFVLDNNLTERHARAVLRLPENRRSEALITIAKRRLNARQTDSYIEQLLNSPPKAGHRISMVRDVRIFVNTIDHAIRLMTDNGVPATAHREEKDGYIEYTVRIPTAAAEK